MSRLLTPDEIEARAKDAGMSIVDACRKAGVAPSTFYRWRNGAKPTIGVYQQLCDATEPEKAV